MIGSPLKEVHLKVHHALMTRSVMFIFILLCAGLCVAAPAQTFTSLADLDGSNGEIPFLNALVQGTDGNFYGTAYDGGAAGQGTVYKVTPGGTISVGLLVLLISAALRGWRGAVFATGCGRGRKFLRHHHRWGIEQGWHCVQAHSRRNADHAL